VWLFDNKNSISATASGFRWQDRRGNSVDYDANGHIVSYADRNAVEVRFSHDAAGRITGVFDHFGRQVLWFD
jgi:YD repeat-containing protein